MLSSCTIPEKCSLGYCKKNKICLIAPKFKDIIIEQDIEKQTSIEDKYKPSKKVKYSARQTNNQRKITFLLKKTKGLCWLCGEILEIKDFSIDHKIPKSLGGTNNIKNLLPAHKRCNQIKSSHLVDSRRDFKKLCVKLKINLKPE